VALARLTLQGANFLLLDEPTNHLDLASQEILEDVLRRFPGTVLLVSHDRYLVQALATHVWRVAGDELRAYKGNYEEYLRQRAAEQVSAADVGAPAPSAEGGDRRDGDRERAREERRLRKAAERQAEQAAALESGIRALEETLARLSVELEGRQPGGRRGKSPCVGCSVSGHRCRAGSDAGHVGGVGVKCEARKRIAG